MGFARKLKHVSSKASKKMLRVSKTVSRKAPGVLNKVGGEMMVAGKIGEGIGGVLAISGQEELAVPLIAASETLKYSGKAVKGTSKAVKKANEGNYVGAVNQVEKTVIDYKKNTDKEDKFK